MVWLNGRRIGSFRLFTGICRRVGFDPTAGGDVVNDDDHGGVESHPIRFSPSRPRRRARPLIAENGPLDRFRPGKGRGRN